MMERQAKLYFNDHIYVYKCDNSFRDNPLLGRYPEVREVMMEYSKFLMESLINKSDDYQERLSDWEKMIDTTLQACGLEKHMMVRLIREYYPNLLIVQDIKSDELLVVSTDTFAAREIKEKKTKTRVKKV